MDERANQFVDYLIGTCIDENATFPPLIWSSCNISSESTTSSCKSIHSVFGKYFYVTHPNTTKCFGFFFEILKLIQL